MVVVADLHFGNESSTLVQRSERLRNMDEDGKLRSIPSIRDRDVYARLREAKEAAEKNDRTLLVAGDIGHKPEVRNDVRSLMFSFLSECRKDGIHVLLMPGNHDAASQNTSAILFEAAELEGCRVVSEPGKVEFAGYEFLALPHIPRSRLLKIEEEYGSYCAYASSLYPDARTVVGHAMVSNTGYENDVFFEAADAMEFDSTAFPKLKLAILGHIHKHWELNTSAGGFVVYPGSVSTNNFGEIDEEKGYLILEKDGSFQWAEWQTPEQLDYVQVDVDLVSKGPDELDYDALKDLSEDAIVRVVVSALTDVIVPETRIRKAVNSRGYLSKIDINRVRAQGQPSELDEADSDADAFRASLDHHALLDEYLADSGAPKDVVKAAKELGHTIINETVAGGK